MTVSLTAALAWCLMPLAFLRSRLNARWRRSRHIEFAPTEQMPPDRLFGCLLSANFAVLMNDNFNQLSSALPERRVKKLLAEHWGIETGADCNRAIDQCMVRLGERSPAERRAMVAWLDERRSAAGHVAPSCSSVERLACEDDVSHGHLSVLAWDIQQVAYLVRLARALDYVSQSDAEAVLERLSVRARAHYGSWKVYSLKSLVGLAMRSSMEVFETAAWERYSHTHSVLLNGRHSPTRFASPWSPARGAVTCLPAGGLRSAFGSSS